jgi:hypothetical protein
MMGTNRVLSSVGNNTIGGSTLSITGQGYGNGARIAGIQHPTYDILKEFLTFFPRERLILFSKDIAWEKGL